MITNSANVLSVFSANMHFNIANIAVMSKKYPY